MVQYRLKDGTLGQFDPDKMCDIRYNSQTNTFTVKLRSYGYDEYDFYDDEITDIIEIRV